MTGTTTYNQPWIRSKVYDTLFILLPPFLALLMVALLPERFKTTNAMPLIWWCILILFVDVAHVYSTLYITYFHKARLRRHNRLFLLVPVACYVVGVMLHLAGGLVFWRALAYVAVFHFIRQQYGFMRLYTRLSDKRNAGAAIDTIAIYAATLYPIIYWHLSPGRNFNWFVANDFLPAHADWLKAAAGVLYLTIIAAYIVKEGWYFIKGQPLNLPKNGLIAGTFISWYFGIVYFNGDLAFTMLNVVSHGIPYIALVWWGYAGRNAAAAPTRKTLPAYWYGLGVFLLSLFLLAYVEEGLWDGFIWKEHPAVFQLFNSLPTVDNAVLLALIVPLLSLPQSTHYVLDGFIWRKRYK